MRSARRSTRPDTSTRRLSAAGIDRGAPGSVCGVNNGQDNVDLPEFASLIAVEIDRTRAPIIDGARARMIAAQLPQRTGLSPAGLQLLPFLRNMLSARRVANDALRACERYIPQSTYDTAVAELIAADLIEVQGSMTTLTPFGRDLAHETHEALLDEVDERWGEHTDMTNVEHLARRVVRAAAATGGLSFSVMTPPYEPPTSTSRSRSAELLNCLRVHRGDAHADAWSSAGLTVGQIQALEPGSERDAIEHETNCRAARPYETLLPQERGVLLDALRALPG